MSSFGQIHGKGMLWWLAEPQDPRHLKALTFQYSTGAILQQSDKQAADNCI